jgi:hypothetical protein
MDNERARSPILSACLNANARKIKLIFHSETIKKKEDTSELWIDFKEY